MKRKPKISLNLADPSAYTDKVMADIVAATKLSIDRPKLVWLQDQLGMRVMLFGADCGRQKTGAAMSTLIGRLKLDFEKAFGREATSTRNGPFIRFVLAVLKPIDMSQPTAESVRHTMRRTV
jgi:hypothetical protein